MIGRPQMLRCAIAASLLLMSACGGGSGGVDPQPVADGHGAFGLFKSAPLTDPDRDGDGIPDVIDPFPSDAPVLADAADNFHLLDVAASGAGHVWRGIVHPALNLQFQVSGLSVAGLSFHAVFVGDDSVEVKALTIQDGALLLSDAGDLDPLYSSVYVMTPVWRTEAYPIDMLAANEPLLAPVDLLVAQGEQDVSIEGVQLNQITKVFLNGAEIDSSPTIQGGVLSLDIPNGAVSGPLAFANGGGTALPRVFPLAVTRRVPVSVDDTMGDTATRAFFMGPLQWVSRLGLGDPDGAGLFQVDSATHRPQIHIFTAPDRFGEAVLRQIVIWPDETSKVLSPDAILEALIFRNLSRMFKQLPKTWEEQKALVVDLLLDPEDRAAGLAEIAEGIDDPSEFLITEALNLYFIEASLREASRKSDAKLFRTEISGKPIYDVVVKAYAGDAAPVDKPELSNYRVAIADSATCQFSYDHILIGAPPGTQKYDLCLENDSQTVASVAVDVLERDLFRPQVDRSMAVRRKDHISTGSMSRSGSLVLHPDVFGGNFGGKLYLAQVQYLTADDSEPLCGMNRCFVEVLTSGWGFGIEQSLSPSEKVVADALFKRSLIEQAVLPLLETVSGGITESMDIGCVAEEVSKTWLTVNANTHDFFSKLNANSSVDEIVAIITDVYLRHVFDLLVSGSLTECIKGEATGAVAGRLGEIGDKIAAGVLGSGAGLVLLVVDLVVKVTELATTPRKIVFDVRPLAELIAAAPVVVEDKGTLRLGGTYFGTQTAGDLDNFLPIVTLFDETGTKAFKQVEHDEFDESGSQFLHINGLPGAADINVSLEDFEGLDALMPGTAYVGLEVDRYDDFDEFNPLPIPGGAIGLQGSPFAGSLKPAVGIPGGQVIKLSGHRLGELVEPGADSISIQLNGGPILRMLDQEFVTVDIEPDCVPTNPDEECPVVFLIQIPDDSLLVPTSTAYAVSFESPVDGETYTASNNLFVTGGGVRVATLSDGGAKIDDAMQLHLLDANGNQFTGGVGLEFSAIRLPLDGVFSGAIWWDSTVITPAKLRIVCDSGGIDNICTYQLDVTREGANFVDPTVGKIPDGGSIEIPIVSP